MQKMKQKNEKLNARQCMVAISYYQKRQSWNLQDSEKD